MIDKSGFQTTLTKHILQLLKDNVPSGIFATYYDGDPVVIPQENYPAICVVKKRSTITARAMGVDDKVEYFNLVLAFDKRQEFDKSADEVVLQETMELLAEGIDEVTGTYSQASVVGILRNKFSLEGWIFNSSQDITYPLNPNRGTVLSQECIIQCTFSRSIQVLNRT